MEEKKIFFMGAQDAYLSLDGRDDDDATDDLYIASANYTNRSRGKESMLAFDKSKLREMLDTASIIFLHGDYKGHLQQIQDAGCFQLIKDKRVLIMAKAKDVSEFQLNDVKFISSTRKAFEAEVGIEREVQAVTPLKRENPNKAILAAEAEKLRREAAEREEAERQEAARQEERRRAELEAEEQKQRREKADGKRDVGAEGLASVVPLPPVQPVPQEVTADPKKEINVALLGAPGIGKADVLRWLNTEQGDVVIAGKKFALNVKFCAESDVYCLMWDVSKPETLTQLLEFVQNNIDNFKQVPMIFVAGNAEGDPALIAQQTNDFYELMDKPESLAEQKERIQHFAEKYELGRPVIIEAIPALKAKIAELANSFSVEVKTVFERMKHSRKVRTEHLNEIFKKEDLDDSDIQWLLLHKASVKPKGLTARLIQDRLDRHGNVDNFVPPREVSPVVSKLLKLLDEKERLIYPKVVMFFRSESFATDYITKNYEGARKAILNVAENIYKADFKLNSQNRSLIFGADESKIPKEVIDMVENQYPQLQLPVVYKVTL